MVFGGMGHKSTMGGGDDDVKLTPEGAEAMAAAESSSEVFTESNTNYVDYMQGNAKYIIGFVIVVIILLAVWYYWDDIMTENMTAAMSELGMHASSAQKSENFYGSAAGLGVRETQGSSKKGLFKANVDDEPEIALVKENFRRDNLSKLDWNGYLAKQNVDDQLKSNHRDFVYRQNMLRTRGGGASHSQIFVPTDAVPWVGLRRPNYWTSYRAGARYVPSVDATQLPTPNRSGVTGI